MDKQTIFLHIGLAKTGTTAIQHFVRLNQDRLAAQGLHFLEADLRLYQSWDTSLMAGQTIPSVETLWKPVREALTKSPANVLHSNEAFTIHAEQKPDFVRDIIEYLPEYSLKVIVYLRRQDRSYESGYLQNIEYFGAANRFDPMPPAGKLLAVNGATVALFDYHAWLEKMRSALREEDDVIVRVYDKPAFVQGSLFKDFIHALGLKWDDGFALPPRDPNPTIDGRYAELCRKSAAFFKANSVQKANEYEEAPFENMLFYQMMQLVNQTIRKTGNKNLMTVDERRAFLNRFKESNDRVAHDFLHQDGPLFDETDLTNPESVAPDRFEDGELEAALVLLHRIWLNSACLEDLGGMNYLRLKQWRRKARRQPDDPRAGRMKKLHKTIYSLGKRLLGWGKVPRMEANLWSMPARNTPPERLAAELRNSLKSESE